MKEDENTVRCPPGIPPWMWFFVAAFTVNLPGILQSWYASYETLLANIESMERLRSVDPHAERFSFLSYPGYFTENLPSAALFLGLFTILFPHFRSLVIERRSKLVAPPASIKSLDEIQEFIKGHAPNLEMKVNLKRPGLAFVYPNTYRRSTVAIFSGFVLLWKTDRKAAEAVLLHEIAHYRRGDALFLGPGSFLENALKLTLVFYLLFVALPYIAITVDQKIQLVESLEKTNAMRREMNQLSRSLGLPEQPVEGYLPQLANSALLSVAGLLATTAAFLVRTAASFILPVAAIWGAEFNADHVVAESSLYKSALVKELGKPRAKISLWRRILFRLSHPPDSLRRWFLRRRVSIAFVLLLLIYPLAMLARIVVLHIWAFLMESGIATVAVIGGQANNFTWRKFLAASIERTQYALTSQSSEWLLMTGILIVWTVAAHPWEHFFMRGREPLLLADASNPIGAPPKSHTRSYALAAAITGAVFVLSLLWKAR